MNAKQLVLPLLSALLIGSCTAHADSVKSTGSAFVPGGYGLVWNDEFESASPSLPCTSDWKYETGGGGWGNGELQYYVPAVSGTDTTAFLKDGLLNIAVRIPQEAVEGHTYLSARMNTVRGWKYGYFEARMKLPEGRGTWPAFWMLPDNSGEWPSCGEIDIMEHAGSHPDSIHISVHTGKYNHIAGTQKTAINLIGNVQDDFHIYGLEWTETDIKGYIDGTLHFRFRNDGKRDKETWPFDTPFHIILNQAVGGMFGGKNGVDDTCYPAMFQIDYVRVYQKK